MKTLLAFLFLMGGGGVKAGVCDAQAPLPDAPPGGAAYSPGFPEASTAWRALAAGYVRKALRDEKLDRDAKLNARVDRIMATMGALAAGIYARFASARWRAKLTFSGFAPALFQPGPGSNRTRFRPAYFAA